MAKAKRKKDVIKVRKHRKKTALRYYVDGTARNRVLDPEKDVDEQIDDLWDELRAGGGRPAKKAAAKPLPELVELWHEDLCTGATSKSAYTSYAQVKRILAEMGITRSGDMTPAKGRTAIYRLRVVPRDSKRPPTDYPLLSDSSRHAYARAIKQFYRWLTDEQYLERNPLASWRLGAVKESQERYPRDRFQSDELAKLIVTARNSERSIEGYTGELRSWVYLIAALTGYRRSELAALTPASFDLAARTVIIPGKFTKNGDQAVQPLHRQLAEELRPWLATQAGHLFPGLAGKRTRKMIKLDLEEAEIPHKTEVGVRCFHSLRNSYISGLLDQGVPLTAVQRLARHSTPTLTAKYGKPANGETALVDVLPYPATEYTSEYTKGESDGSNSKTR
jgi:integrase